MKTLIRLAGCIAVALFGQLSAQNSLDYSLGDPLSGETISNQLVYASGGVTATVTGWSISRTASGPEFQASQVARWSPGIGVKNSTEYITDVPYVPFYVDNQDHYDFALFTFSGQVDIDSLRITPSAGTFDLDVSFWLGNVDSGLKLSGQSLSTLASLGFGSRINDDWYATNSPRTVNVNSPFGGVNALLVAARVGGDADFDRFKISTIQGTSIIPEPSAFGLLGVAVAMLAIRRRR